MEKGLIIKEKIDNLDFDYGTVDKETENIMKQAVDKMCLITQNTKFVMGEQLNMVQERLAGNNQYDGFLGKWYSALGLKKDVVYDCINYYKVLVANSENEMIQELSFSKVCEVAKIKGDIELQKEVIEKAPLKEMKVKQVTELVKQVNSRKEVTEELINEIMKKNDETNTSLKNFMKVTNVIVDKIKEKNMSKEDIEKILNVINELKDLCSMKQDNLHIEEEV